MAGDLSAAPRTYGEGCALAHALDLIGERWAMLVIRELLFGPKRFSDLQAGLPHASPNVLSQRLRELERAEVVQRRRLGPPVRAYVYELTDRGRALEPALVHLGQWGAQSRFLSGDGDLSIDSLLLALKSHFDPQRAGSLSATIGVAIGDDTFSVRIDHRQMTIKRGTPDSADLHIRTDMATFRNLAIHGEAGPGLELTGSPEILEQLLNAIHE